MVSVGNGIRLTQAKRAFKAKAKSALPLPPFAVINPAISVCLDYMGLEAVCPVRLGAGTFSGKVHLNTDRVEIRGDTRIDIAFAAIRTVMAEANGALIINHSGGRAILEMGNQAAAEKWSLKIRSPKSLIDKLGVKPDSRVSVLGVTDTGFLAQLKERLAGGLAPAAGPRRDFIFYGADSVAQLAKLKSLKSRLQPAGAIWVVSLKGKAAVIKDTDVMKAARSAGLVDNKVCSFSPTHTALKLVIPKHQR
jgi:hypothetical protein